MEILRFDDASEAADSLEHGEACLILASGYPERATSIDAGLLYRLAEMEVRLYVEYPDSLPGVQIEAPRKAQWERCVVTTNCFEPSLRVHQIMDLHGCHLLPLQAEDPLLVLGRVAGLDSAVYGPPTPACPILFRHHDSGALVSTTKLSNFRTGRYAPVHAWTSLWRGVIGWLTGGTLSCSLTWTPTVRPAFEREEPVATEVERNALARGLEWFFKSGVISSEGGAHGLMEGFGSQIDHNGKQPIRGTLRCDCIGEGAGALAFGKILPGKHRGPSIAANLMDYIFFESVFAKGSRADPQSPSYGLLSWTSSPPADGVYYGDDNARSMLGMIACISLLRSARWNEHLLRCLLANLRTTGRNGFRGWRLEESDLQEQGWQHFRDRANVFYAPHYEAYLWACFLWAYRQTGFTPFLDKPRKAIGMMMDAYPDRWHWTNGIAQERARMLLPLSWLVRVDDTPQHREWLNLMGREVLARQEPCGALREELGGPGKGSYGAPKSNDEYGEREATLMQKNGDPISDMLYTTNFAFLGLHEAAATTQEPLFVGAENRLADFLCRIQTVSDIHPELDGAWYRGFDFDRWEYWGSNADAGWGVWSIESGWTQSWIVSVLAMRVIGTSLWELSSEIRISERLKSLVDQMLE